MLPLAVRPGLGQVWLASYNPAASASRPLPAALVSGPAGRFGTRGAKDAMPRQSFQNNTRLVLAIAAGTLLVFLVVEVLLRKSRDFSPDFLASVLLYGLTVLNLTLLLVLIWLLGRSLVRVLMERRRGVLGARFR